VLCVFFVFAWVGLVVVISVCDVLVRSLLGCGFVFHLGAAADLVSACFAMLLRCGLLCRFGLLGGRRRMMSRGGRGVGVGLVVMHYVGMAALELCRAVYSPISLILLLSLIHI